MKLYGTAMSRSARCLWALEELGIKYDHIPVEVPKAKSPEVLKINPNGQIPTLDDNGVAVWESMAINLYLAEKYGRAPLWPSTPEGHAEAYQWSFWGMTQVEPHLLTLLLNRMFLPAEKRSEEAANQALEALKPPLKVLNHHLEGREHLLGKDFTIADLNLASIMALGTWINLDLSATPAAKAWLDRSLVREASQRAHKMK